MSGFAGANTSEGGNQFTEIMLTGRVGSDLTDILMAEAIVPGSPPSYQLCKTIYTSHILGAKMAETPVNMAQSQEREISIPVVGEAQLIEAFKREWKAIGNGQGADALIKNTQVLARVYGIASVVMGDRAHPDRSDKAVDWAKLADADVYFSILDPLNTSGSLVLDQDPNSPDFLKATAVRVGSRVYHPSRSVVVMNEAPVYIEWTNSAFGFVGRSVYQRALFPLKTIVQSMITDDMVTKKVGLLIYKAKAPGSVQSARILQFFGWKRSQLQGGVTGNVLNVGIEEEIESLNFQNLEGPARFARDNALKNTAMAAGMPARMLEQEELVSGFGEGTEDAKAIARYVDRLRIEMAPLYAYFDRIVQRRAWSPAFYETMRHQHAEYRDMPYETAFYGWANKFTAIWPNLLVEPDSERVKVEETRFKSIVAVIETMSPLLDPENKAALVSWAADEINSRKDLFASPLMIDEEALANYQPATSATGEDERREPEPRAFSYES